MTNNSIRELYEDSLKVYRDLKNVIDTAELKGQKKGFEQGRKQGIEQGRKQGIEQGSVEERKKIAKTMKALNMPLEDISKATGMTIDEIVNL
jgi:predicted transposase/invertase (TIGR01784 family)